MRTLQRVALPGRRRDLVGDAVVDGGLVELVGAVGQAQRVQAQPARRPGRHRARRSARLPAARRTGARRRASACRAAALPSARNSVDSCVAASASMLRSAAQSKTQGSGICSVCERSRATASMSSSSGADPADVAADRAPALLRGRLRRPPRRPPAWAARTTAAPTSRTAARSRAPGSRTAAAGRWRGTGRTAPARSRHAGARAPPAPVSCDSDCSHWLKSALAKAITASSSSGSCTTSLTSTPKRCSKSPVSPVVGQRQRCQRRQAAGRSRTTGAGACGAAHVQVGQRRQRRRSASRCASSGTPADGRRRGPDAASAAGFGRRVEEVRTAACPSGEDVLADHLLLDLVDLGLDAALGRALALSDCARFGVVEPRRTAQRGQLLGRQPFAAHLAQHVELALAHEIVAPLALDHRLQLGLLEVELARVVLPRAQVGPVRGRVGHEA